MGGKSYDAVNRVITAMRRKNAYVPPGDDDKGFEEDDAVWLYRTIKRFAPQVTMLSPNRIRVPVREGERPWTYIIDVDIKAGMGEGARRERARVAELQRNERIMPMMRDGVRNCVLSVEGQRSREPGYPQSREDIVDMIWRSPSYKKAYETPSPLVDPNPFGRTLYVPDGAAGDILHYYRGSQ
jgi:hypothetical protein